MKCPECGEDHLPGDVVFEEKRPGQVGFTINILKIPSYWKFVKSLFRREKKDVADNAYGTSNRCIETGDAKDQCGTKELDG